jgi:uncharacterized protein YjaZ
MKKLLPFIFALFLLSGISQRLSSQTNYPTNPEEAVLVYTDLENFLEAYKLLRPDVDSIAVLNQYYFNRGSVGLNEYILKHSLTPEMMVEAIGKDPEVYEQIGEFVNNIDETKKIFKESMIKYSNVLSKATYPPTYLLVGANRGIAQNSKFGPLVTIAKVLDDPDTLMQVIVHELSHFQQVMNIGIENYIALYSKPDNMLGLCLREGGAEFLTYLVMKGISQEKALNFLEENLPEMKSKFILDLEEKNSDYWLWGSLNQNEYPKLLGYAMGYKICESYYNGAADKEKALTDILSITQSEEFLDQSGFYSK